MSKVYTLGCKDIGIQIFDFDAKTRFLLEFNAYTFPPVQFFTGMIKKSFLLPTFLSSWIWSANLSQSCWILTQCGHQGAKNLTKVYSPFSRTDLKFSSVNILLCTPTTTWREGRRTRSRVEIMFKPGLN